MVKAILLHQMKNCALEAKSFLGGLIGDVAQASADALEEMDAAKGDKPAAVPFTIPVEGWKQDETATKYPQYYDHPVTGLTAKDRASVTIAPEYVDVAGECGICPTNETIAGAIRLRSSAVPKQEIQAEYWVSQGR